MLHNMKLHCIKRWKQKYKDKNNTLSNQIKEILPHTGVLIVPQTVDRGKYCFSKQMNERRISKAKETKTISFFNKARHYEDSKTKIVISSSTPGRAMGVSLSFIIGYVLSKEKFPNAMEDESKAF